MTAGETGVRQPARCHSAARVTLGQEGLARFSEQKFQHTAYS
jgi:hypothetical protein